MSWTETHRRWAALREVAETADQDGDGELPWTEEYADIFGDRDQLIAQLRYRWELTAGTQLDSHLPEAELDDRFRDLAARNAGVLRILRRHDPTYAVTTGGVNEVDEVAASA